MPTSAACRCTIWSPLDLDLLARTENGVFAEERLNRVLRGLDPAEQRVVVAYAEGEGATWTEAASARRRRSGGLR
ncbi:hypothetical protein AB0M32_09930 [Streptomyces sp. NPDC051985]|uniref:hypothetical protein n=1 Tax=Streptomyces sp. NPDC051985 TaxID=3155807 RepID=UPI00342E8529